MNLLKKGDWVKCPTLEDRELIINIALANGIIVYPSTEKRKQNNMFPNLEWSASKRLSGTAYSGSYTSSAPLSVAQFIAKMLGVELDKNNKKRELLEQIEVLKKQVKELDLK